MKKLSILNISLLTLAFLSSSHAQEQKIVKLNQTKIFNTNQRIVGGTEVSESDDTWRFIVALKYPSGFQFCAGNLISPEWVLTAAHCSTDESTLVGVGNYNRTQTTNYHVAEFIRHANYNSQTSDNDIALIHLTQPVNEPNVTPIAYDISSSPTPSGTASETAGWGRTSQGGPASDTLLEVTVPIIDRDTCNALDSYNGVVTDNMLCAGYMSGGKDSCNGDSGGPLIANNTLIGIVSWGYGCARETKPGVYTNVKQYADWIQEHIGEIDINNTTYETAHPYVNNTTELHELSIPNVSNLRVTITGETEQNYDKIFITDSTGNETVYTGVLDEEIFVPGDHITVRFTSDGSVVKNGVVVHVYEALSDNNTTTYETAHPYSNNTTEIHELSIPDALNLRVTISGEVEQNYDKIFITDSTGNETVYTGVLAEEIIVPGDHITVKFTSDGSIVKHGALVQIFSVIPDNASTYETGHPYANNTDETQVLSIPNSFWGLDVNITGEVEQNYDKIFITDASGNETVYTGLLNENVHVEGDHITVRFTSDGSVVKEGARVHITKTWEGPPSIYETDHPYANNTDETQELSIAGASNLTVIITGEVEQNYDKIFITDSTENETVYTGVLNEEFTVPGDHITVRFTSDSSVVKNGARVEILSSH